VPQRRALPRRRGKLIAEPLPPRRHAPPRPQATTPPAVPLPPQRSHERGHTGPLRASTPPLRTSSTPSRSPPGTGLHRDGTCSMRRRRALPPPEPRPRAAPRRPFHVMPSQSPGAPALASPSPPHRPGPAPAHRSGRPRPSPSSPASRIVCSYVKALSRCHFARRSYGPTRHRLLCAVAAILHHVPSSPSAVNRQRPQLAGRDHATEPRPCWEPELRTPSPPRS